MLQKFCRKNDPTKKISNFPHSFFWNQWVSIFFLLFRRSKHRAKKPCKGAKKALDCIAKIFKKSLEKRRSQRFMGIIKWFNREYRINVKIYTNTISESDPFLKIFRDFKSLLVEIYCAVLKIDEKSPLSCIFNHFRRQKFADWSNKICNWVTSRDLISVLVNTADHSDQAHLSSTNLIFAKNCEKSWEKLTIIWFTRSHFKPVSKLLLSFTRIIKVFLFQIWHLCQKNFTYILLKTFWSKNFWCVLSSIFIWFGLTFLLN